MFLYIQCCKIHTATRPFISCCFTSAFTSTDIISTSFWNFIQYFLKKGFCQKFPFFNGFTPTPHPGSLTPLEAKIRCELNFLLMLSNLFQLFSSPTVIDNIQFNKTHHGFLTHLVFLSGLEIL